MSNGMNGKNNGISNKSSALEITILGCGVIGLSSALELLQRGFKVKIVAAELPPHTTSDIAAAVWYPFKVHPQDKVLAWSKASLDKYYEFAESKDDAGVFLCPLLELHVSQVEEKPWWTKAVRKFEKAAATLLPDDYSSGYQAEIAVINASVFLEYLMKKVISLGGKIEKLPARFESVAELSALGKLVVNCTGLGAGKLCKDDAVYPIKGQVVRTTRPDFGSCVFDDYGPRAISYIVPRQDDCILGGTAAENDWDLAADDKVAKTIMTKCTELVPELARVQVLEHKVGLRPGRNQIRLELESFAAGEELSCGGCAERDFAVIHNYGHGGAGFTVAWGCAQEVAELAQSFARNG
ncbi:MAG: FAD-binding oxidoreductase [Candidatus Obscuribacterales bacterium]|nr:FAD-binding oxidoreductase [Candidatus Obscuribacterales bacterium]